MHHAQMLLQRRPTRVRRRAPFAWKRLDARVPPTVLRQVRLLSEPFAAHCARKRAFLPMRRRHMAPQMIGAGKALVARRARVRSHRRVHGTNVRVQIAVGHELARAERAANRSDAGVRFQMVLEAGNGGETFVAQRTAERVVGNMGGFAMQGELLLIGKGGRAFGTMCVWGDSVANCGALVLEHVWGGFVGARTVFAREDGGARRVRGPSESVVVQRRKRCRAKECAQRLVGDSILILVLAAMGRQVVGFAELGAAFVAHQHRFMVYVSQMLVQFQLAVHQGRAVFATRTTVAVLQRMFCKQSNIK